MDIIEKLSQRGIIKQTVYKEELTQMLASQSMTFYVGFDPTADSLHAGHLLTLMAMGHLQRAGHKPIVLLGGGTGMIGDPSGRTDMRKFLSKEDIQHNIDCFKKQMSRFFSFEGENAAIMVNNADWLLDLNYVEFLRQIGVHFSVNRMLTAECFKTRLEKGLSFMEFNYMLMQAYDFLELFRRYGCRLECGGDDQWSNILAGADLIRRKENTPAFALTFTLLTTSDGKKMGKTQKGAVWLDKNKTSAYDFFQYFRNIDDGDVKNCLKLLTLLDLDEIEKMTMFNDERINLAKEKLAYEVTKIVHGQQDADLALEQARAAFSGGQNMPKQTISGINKIIDILVELKLSESKSQAKRLIEGGAIKINDDKIDSIDYELPDTLKQFILHKGKKVHIKVEII